MLVDQGSLPPMPLMFLAAFIAWIYKLALSTPLHKERQCESGSFALFLCSLKKRNGHDQRLFPLLKLSSTTDTSAPLPALKHGSLLKG